MGRQATFHASNVASRTGDELAEERRFAFTDHREQNKQLAFRTMTRREAHELNTRLKGTGFAWAQIGGY